MPRKPKGKTDGFVLKYLCELVNVVEKIFFRCFFLSVVSTHWGETNYWTALRETGVRYIPLELMIQCSGQKEMGNSSSCKEENKKEMGKSYCPTNFGFLITRFFLNWKPTLMERLLLKSCVKNRGTLLKDLYIL